MKSKRLHQNKYKRNKKQRKKTKKYKAYLFSQMKGGNWTPNSVELCKKSIIDILSNGDGLEPILKEKMKSKTNIHITPETNYQNTQKITNLMNNIRKCFPNDNRSNFHIMALVNADEEKKYLTDLLKKKK